MTREGTALPWVAKEKRGCQCGARPEGGGLGARLEAGMGEELVAEWLGSYSMVAENRGLPEGICGRGRPRTWGCGHVKNRRMTTELD